MKSKLQVCKEILPELQRFQKKLTEAIEELKEDSNESQASHTKYAAAKRSALDLKKELTKLTQDSNYRYNN